MKIHRVKCFFQWFTDVVNGKKPFEIRKFDRDYQIGDLLELYATIDGEYTGKAALFEITTILTHEAFPEGIKDGYAILGIKPVVSSYYTDYEKEKV